MVDAAMKILLVALRGSQYLSSNAQRERRELYSLTGGIIYAGPCTAVKRSCSYNRENLRNAENDVSRKHSYSHALLYTSGPLVGIRAHISDSLYI